MRRLSMDDWLVSGGMIRWLSDEGFLTRSERRFFHFRK